MYMHEQNCVCIFINAYINAYALMHQKHAYTLIHQQKHARIHAIGQSNQCIAVDDWNGRGNFHLESFNDFGRVPNCKIICTDNNLVQSSQQYKLLYEFYNKLYN